MHNAIREVKPKYCGPSKKGVKKWGKTAFLQRLVLNLGFERWEALNQRVQLDYRIHKKSCQVTEPLISNAKLRVYFRFYSPKK